MSWTRWGFAEPLNQTWWLGKNQTSHLAGAHGPVAIEVARGLVLVTREGDPEDHVLRAGEALVLPRRGKVVAWALEPTLATVHDA